MVKRLLWKTSKNSKSASKNSNRSRKRTSQAVEAESSGKSKCSLRLSKRVRGNTGSTEEHNQSRISTRICSSRKEYPRMKKNRLGSTKILVSNNSNREREIFADSTTSIDPSDFVSQEPPCVIVKGLLNLGNSCFFNSVIQCLYHCPKFKTAIENIAPEALTVPVVNELQLLFGDMGAFDSFPYTLPLPNVSLLP